MPRGRKSARPLRGIHTNIYADDYEWLRERYPLHGPQAMIRAIVARFVKNKREEDLTELESEDGEVSETASRNDG